MEKHHKESIEKFVSIYKDEPGVLAILLGGSIAHGFAEPQSDIDVIIIVEESEYQKRKKENKLTFSLHDICTYPGGYIDCKVVNVGFLEMVKERGSDPARYAFKDSIILFSRINNLESLLEQITSYPVKDKDIRRKRFVSQLLAWKWYYHEAVKKKNLYLIYLSIQKIVLFSCRIVLNENNMLYPYHKWLLNEVQKAQNKPNNFDENIKKLLAQHTPEYVNQFCSDVLHYLGLEESSVDWPNQFLLDSEWNWIEHEPPVDDL